MDAGPVITTYGYTETVSILDRKGEWVKVRTTDGTGWARAADLIGVEQVELILKDPKPRFATPPAAVENRRARGEIVIEAKVNTDGDVVGVRVTRDTTGVQKLADSNASALQQAKFYPIVQKGQRMTFGYTYRVSY
jgi:TonB family protein